MKQVIMVMLTALVLVTVPALSSASDRRGSSGYAELRTTVFQYGHGDHRAHDTTRVKYDNYRRDSRHEKSWKHAKRHDRYERGERHRHNSRAYWGHERGHRHDRDRVEYRYVPPRQTVVRERVVVSPVIPVPLPPSLVFHFSW